MVRTQPIALNSAARRLASSKSATAMASAAVTAASTAAALVPFLMSLGCLPAKGASRNFLMRGEWAKCVCLVAESFPPCARARGS
jgi:hypothetical protein